MVSTFSQEVRFLRFGISFRHFCSAWKCKHYTEGILESSFIAMARPVTKTEFF